MTDDSTILLKIESYNKRLTILWKLEQNKILRLELVILVGAVNAWPGSAFRRL